MSPTPFRSAHFRVSTATGPRVPCAAIPIYLLLSGAGSLFFSMIVTANLLYHVETVGLSPLQLVLVGTTLEAVVVLFEIPTGVVADLVSRRRSIIIGNALIGLGFMIEGSFPAFGAILIAQVLWGIGYTFTRGATEAWITDEVGADRVGGVLLRGHQAYLVGSFSGIVIGTALGLFAIQLPIVLGGVGLIVLAAVLLRAMPETNFHPAPREERSTWRHMVQTAREGATIARSCPVVQVLLLTSSPSASPVRRSTGCGPSTSSTASPSRPCRTRTTSSSSASSRWSAPSWC